MGRRMLVPVDGSPPAWEAFEYALDEFPDATLVVLTVIDPVEASYAGEGHVAGAEGWYENRRAAAEELFARARERAGDRAGDMETAVEVGRPARAIVDYAGENDVDGIVMGSHGRSGVARILLGSVAETVVRRSPVPVTVVR
ncbi:MAG: universal stress protein [Halobacteriaceae archaeon]